jgi:predicted ATPase
MTNRQPSAAKNPLLFKAKRMLIKRLALKKILSFNDAEIELGQLNVLIGPNAVGKSNLIEVISLLQAAPTNLAAAILRGGGGRQWLWLGDREPSPAHIECELILTREQDVGPIGYQLQFEDASGFVIVGEALSRSTVPIDLDEALAYFVRHYNQARFRAQAPESGHAKYESIKVSPGESVLSQFKIPGDFTPITEVGYRFAQIRIFREFRTGPGSAARYGISTSVPKDALVDGSDNLALVLHELDFLGVHERILGYLRRFCGRFEDVKVNVGEGLARAYLREAGLTEMLSGIRMSDGTLKFLSLLAALFHPKPPPLMCIEEPEIGLHPDALQLVAEALVEASESMQLIVTTHSDALIDYLTDRPETVLVCERDFDNGTQMKRLSKDHLKAWLEHYTLGQLWRKGEIGGGRW